MLVHFSCGARACPNYSPKPPHFSPIWLVWRSWCLFIIFCRFYDDGGSNDVGYYVWKQTKILETGYLRRRGFVTLSYLLPVARSHHMCKFIIMGINHHFFVFVFTWGSAISPIQIGTYSRRWAVKLPWAFYHAELSPPAETLCLQHKPHTPYDEDLATTKTCSFMDRGAFPYPMK